jgi:hypothetical protein
MITSGGSKFANSFINLATIFEDNGDVLLRLLLSLAEAVSGASSPRLFSAPKMHQAIALVYLQQFWPMR